VFRSLFTSGGMLAALLLASVTATAQEPLAINYVVIDERLHTSGQPQADVLTRHGIDFELP
jgi:hypothetical protein